MSLLETVPNLSEGRDPDRIRALRDALGGAPGVRLLDASSDPDHHRSVLTAAGDPAALEAGLVTLARAAVELIDLGRHRGVHPRLGAVDLVPFVPLGESTMASAVAAAESLGARLGDELGIPVFFYGEAARRPELRVPAALRRLGLDGVARAIASGELVPDRGPRRVHATAGVTLVGARGPLVAFNLWLASDDLEVASEVARAVRESDGGLPGVQALGLRLASRGRVQVSLNLMRPDRTSLAAVVERVRAEAGRRGVEIERGELVGLLPESVAMEAAAAALRLPGLGPGQILERRLAQPD